MPYTTCSHRKRDGVLCGSPALRGEKYCFFHTRELHDAIFGAQVRRRRSACRFALPPLDDPRVIQDLLSQILAGLCDDTIDYQRATAMLPALRLASNELRNPSG
jgi:hypothetical protein